MLDLVPQQQSMAGRFSNFQSQRVNEKITVMSRMLFFFIYIIYILYTMFFTLLVKSFNAGGRVKATNPVMYGTRIAS